MKDQIADPESKNLRWSEFLISIKSILPQAFLLFSAILLAVQFLHMAGLLSAASTPKSITGTFDDDALLVQNKALKTRWYKDNGVAGYGPLYFRLVHTIASLQPGPRSLSDDLVERDHERSVHYLLMLVSLGSVWGISLLLVSLLTTRWVYRLALSSVLLSAFMSEPTWALFVRRAHPDHLFSLTVAAATILTFRWLCLKNSKDCALNNSAQRFFYLSAAMWGIVAGIKLSIILFVPAFVLLFWPYNDSLTQQTQRPAASPSILRRQLQAFGLFLAFMFIAYFALAFPQSIVLDRPIRFLLKQSTYSQRVDWPALWTWAQLFFAQTHRPLGILAVAALFFTRPRLFNPQWDSIWRTGALVFFPILLLVSRKVISAFDHYPFPHVTGLLILFIFTLSWLGFKTRLSKYPGLGLVLLFSWTHFSWGFVPRALTVASHEHSACRNIAAEFEQLVSQELRPTDKAMIDPYFPVDPGKWPKGQVERNWTANFEYVDQNKITFIGLNSKYYSRYFGDQSQNTYIQNYHRDWQSSQKFYETFHNRKAVQDDVHGSWQLLRGHNECGLFIWRK